MAERVRADGIDILVDLAGHTMPLPALLAFALKPAPEHLFSEKVYRQPAFGQPWIVRRSVFENGYVTFGCCS